MHIRSPIFLRRVDAPGAEAFAVLFTLESFSRAVLTTVIPLDALRVLGDAQSVSILFFLVSGLSLCGSLGVPWLVRRLSRRWVYTGGAGLLIGASVLLAVGTLPFQAAGMAVRVLGVVTLTIVVNLYIMDHIGRRDLGRVEPMRLFYAAGAWTLGPVTGVYLATRIHPAAPYALSALAGGAMLVYFWFLRLTERPALFAARGPTPSPLKSLGRYFAQPRLVFAWVLAVGRNSWWVMFYIYGPIYAVQSGLGELAGGILASAGTAFLFLMPVLGRYARSAGIRRICMLGFGGAAAGTLAAAASFEAPLAVAAFLMLAGLSMAAIDAVGNVPFMVAVRPHRRPEMTAVYSTFRDVADLATPGAFALVLKLFALPAVFVAGGLTMLALALTARRAHPRLGVYRRDRQRVLPDPSPTA